MSSRNFFFFCKFLRESFTGFNVLTMKYLTFFTLLLSVRLSLSPYSYSMYLQSCAHCRGDYPTLTDDGSSTVEVPLPIHSHLKQGFFWCNWYFCTDVDTGGQNNSSQWVQEVQLMPSCIHGYRMLCMPTSLGLRPHTSFPFQCNRYFLYE